MITNAQIASSFAKFKPVTAAMDYSDPTVCPYCRDPMTKTTIQKIDGTVEHAYLCSADRAVGVVPDTEEELKIFPEGL